MSNRITLAVLCCIALLVTIIVSTQYSRISVTTVVALGIGFITVALFCVTTARRDTLTTMSLLPVWKSRESEAGTK